MSSNTFKRERDYAHFNDWAPTYEDSRIQRVRDGIHESLAAYVSSTDLRPKRILDVGCGTGALLRRVVERFPEAALTGVDISPNMVSAARERVPQGLPVTFVEGPAEKLPFEDGQFDLVVSTICFHHWASRVEGLAEISRVLRPGGNMFIADHFAIGWLRPFFAVTRCRDRVHTPGELDRMISTAGLRTRQWRLLYRLGRLPFIHGVWATKP